jgi:cysteine synthase A
MTPMSDVHEVNCPRRVPTCLVSSSMLDMIGHTPLISLRGASASTGCRVLAKAEYLNPSGSIKDRVAHFLLEEAERRGELTRGDTVLEVTSGNTGIALAMVGAMKGYHVVIMMPCSLSHERRNMIRGFGAELRLLDGLLHIQSAVRETIELAQRNPRIFLPSQFSNPDNPRCHELGTGPEILAQVGGKFDAFVMGVGTGGTLMGVARALRRAGSPARIVAVEPAESAVMSGNQPGCHGIQGLADGFIPEIVDLAQIDKIVRISTEEAHQRARQLAREEGLLVGISAGANVLAAERVALELGPGHTVVTILPDRGERYLSLEGGTGA